MDADQVRARLQALEEERRQLQREQDEADAAARASPDIAAAAPASAASLSTQRQLWALARKMMAQQQEIEPSPEEEDGAGPDGDGNKESLDVLREAINLLEALTAVAALPPPAHLASSSFATRDATAPAAVASLPALVEQHLAARTHMEALLEAEQRACRSNCTGRRPEKLMQQLLGALLRLVRCHGRAMRERLLGAVRRQMPSFPPAASDHGVVDCPPTRTIAASVHRRARVVSASSAISSTTSGLLPLLLALERLNAAAAARPLPVSVSDGTLLLQQQRRKAAASSKSPQSGGTGSSSPLAPSPPSQLERLLAGVAHALVDHVVLPAAAPSGRTVRLEERPVEGEEGGGEEIQQLVVLGSAASGQQHQQQQCEEALAAAVAATEAVAGFVCDGLLDGEPWWAQGASEALRPLLAPLMGPLMEALAEGLAEALLQARPQDDEAARGLLRPLLLQPPQGQGQGQGRSLALQRFLEQVALRALAGQAAAGPSAGTAAAMSLSGPFGVRDLHARAVALGRSQELLAGLVSPPQPQKQQQAETEAAALRAWRALLREACAAPSPATAPPAVLACIPREMAALAAAIGDAAPAAASKGGAEGRTSRGSNTSLSPALRRQLAEALLAFGHRQARGQQQLQGGVGGRDWSLVDAIR